MKKLIVLSMMAVLMGSELFAASSGVPRKASFGFDDDWGGGGEKEDRPFETLVFIEGGFTLGVIFSGASYSCGAGIRQFLFDHFGLGFVFERVKAGGLNADYALANSFQFEMLGRLESFYAGPFFAYDYFESFVHHDTNTSTSARVPSNESLGGGVKLGWMYSSGLMFAAVELPFQIFNDIPKGSGSFLDAADARASVSKEYIRFLGLNVCLGLSF